MAPPAQIEALDQLLSRSALGDQDAFGAQTQHLEQISPDLARGLERRVDIQTGTANRRRHVRGQQPHLNLPGDPQVALGGCFHRIGIGLGLQQ